jgi:hypothetical protein
MNQHVRKVAVGAALVATTLTGGVIGANLIGTSGAQTTSTTAPSTNAPPPPGAPNGNFDPSKGGHQANGVTETLLTGDDASKATAAANAAVPGATIERVETDAEGAAYEAHMVKSDGTHVTVKMDKDFKVTGTETGGPGGPHGPGGPGRPGDRGPQPSSTTPTTAGA